MEENELTGILQNILGDPDTMKKLSSVAEELFGGDTKAPSEAVREDTPSVKEENLSSLLTRFPILSKFGDDKQVALIRALMPYLSAKRRSAAENILSVMKLLKMSSLFSSNG